MAIPTLDLVITVEDHTGKQSDTTVYFRKDVGLEILIQELGVAGAELIDGIHNGKTVSAQVCAGVDLSGLTGNINDASGDVEEAGRLLFRSLPGFDVNVTVPAFNTLNAPEGSRAIDLGDADVAALETILTTNFVTANGPIRARDVGNAVLTELVSGRESTRPTGKRVKEDNL